MFYQGSGKDFKQLMKLLLLYYCSSYAPQWYPEIMADVNNNAIQQYQHDPMHNLLQNLSGLIPLICMFFICFVLIKIAIRFITDVPNQTYMKLSRPYGTAKMITRGTKDNDTELHNSPFQPTVDDDWNELVRKSNTLMNNWKNMSTDLNYILKYPMIQDYTNPQVQEVIKSLSILRNKIPQNRPVDVTNVHNSVYSDYVAKFESALDTVIMVAEKTRTSNMSLDERRKLEQAFQMLQIVRNDASTLAERKLSYERLKLLLNELNIIIREDTRERLMLENPFIREIEG